MRHAIECTHREEPSLKNSQYDSQSRKLLPFLHESHTKHNTSPETADGRKEYPWSNLLRKNSSRRLEENIGGEKDERHNAVRDRVTIRDGRSRCIHLKLCSHASNGRIGQVRAICMHVSGMVGITYVQTLPMSETQYMTPTVMTRRLSIRRNMLLCSAGENSLCVSFFRSESGEWSLVSSSCLMAAKSFFSSLRTASIVIFPSLILSEPIQGEHSEDEVEDMRSMASFLYILASSLAANSLGSRRLQTILAASAEDIGIFSEQSQCGVRSHTAAGDSPTHIDYAGKSERQEVKTLGIAGISRGWHMRSDRRGVIGSMTWRVRFCGGVLRSDFLENGPAAIVGSCVPSSLEYGPVFQ